VGAENLMGSMTSLPCGVKKLDRERKPGRLLGSVGARPQRSPDLIDEKRTAGTIETATSSRSMGTGTLFGLRRVAPRFRRPSRARREHERPAEPE